MAIVHQIRDGYGHDALVETLDGHANGADGEKFAANPVTGSATFSVPLPVSPGRGGFGPQLALSYAGNGNGAFGFGWSLSLPSISRKTDKGLPRYADGTDTLLISGADDLVPILDANDSIADDGTFAPGYVIRRYRLRIEGLFARIERWTRSDGDVTRGLRPTAYRWR
jgi:hypothetical protein